MIQKLLWKEKKIKKTQFLKDKLNWKIYLLSRHYMRIQLSGQYSIGF
jgi:hypothetical protein